MFSTAFMKDQVAVVTGGGTGIGLAIARRFAELGAGVVLASRSADHLRAGAEALGGEGGKVLTVPTDVRDPAQVDAMVARALDRFGRIDVLVNNAAGNFIVRAEDLSPNAACAPSRSRSAPSPRRANRSCAASNRRN